MAQQTQNESYACCYTLRLMKRFCGIYVKLRKLTLLGFYFNSKINDQISPI